MQNNLICSDIIPQLDPKVQEVMNNFRSRMEEIQNSEQYKQMTESVNRSVNEILQIKLNPEVQEKLEQFKHDAEVFNEKIKAIFDTVIITVKKTVVNVYKKIISCSRAVRSHIKTSNFSKSSSGDSGDSDQPPEPARLSHLKTQKTIKHNRIIFSWYSASCSCLMVGGGRHD